MQPGLVEILACPLDGHHPLRLTVLERHNAGGREEIVEGVLICARCATAFPVVAGIPHLVRGGLRQPEIERDFASRHGEALRRAADELHLGAALELPRGAMTDHDRNLIAEGDYWGRFLHEHVARGDLSILDVRCRGTHPPFLNAGVTETDQRDAGRAMGYWPDHLSRPMRRWIEECRGGRVLDVGCGGGQFGLEPARMGLRGVGMDVSPASLALARRHALSVGADIDYVYADPAQPPFRDATFDLLVGKDALHHLTAPADCLARLERVLAPQGRVLFYDHVHESAGAQWIRGAAARALLPLIRRRYPPGDIPAIFHEGSVHEDVGREEALAALKGTFETERVIGELFLYYEIEQLAYFASGKRAWLSRLCARAVYALERLWLLFGRPEHVLFLGRKKR